MKTRDTTLSEWRKLRVACRYVGYDPYNSAPARLFSWGLSWR